MSPQKHPATRRFGGPGASHENREQPAKSKPHGELSQPKVKSGNAQKREQNKRMDQANIRSAGQSREHAAEHHPAGQPPIGVGQILRCHDPRKAG
jgi:hypothetical protein